MRASYKDAIFWVALNDDTEWLAADEPIPSVTALLIADVFGKTEEVVIRDLRAALLKRTAVSGR